MFKDKTKRIAVGDVQAETVLDLLQFLPKRLLDAIIKEHGLKPVNHSKNAAMMVIAENRKTIFRSLKFTLSYVKRESE